MRSKLVGIFALLALLVIGSSLVIFGASYKYYFTGREENNLRKAVLKFNLSSDKSVMTGELKVTPYCSSSVVATGGELSFNLRFTPDGYYSGRYQGHKLICKDVRFGRIGIGAKTSGTMKVRKKKIRGTYYLEVELVSQGRNRYLFPGKGKIPF